MKIWLKTLYEKAKLKTKDYWQHLKIFQRKKFSLKMSFAQIKKVSKIWADFQTSEYSEYTYSAQMVEILLEFLSSTVSIACRDLIILKNCE